MSTYDRAPGHTSGTADRAARDLHPPVQVIHLGELAVQVAAERERHNADHTAYTLRNAVALRQVLLSFRPGGRMPDHHADGGVAIHVLAGEVAVEAQGTEYALGAGDILDLAPGLPHTLQARAESTVLLTIAPVGSVAHPSPSVP
jgi:quercetin dioxygenase-like cupin family protein